MTGLRDFRGVAKPVGVVLVFLSMAMALCAGLGLAFDQLADPAEPARPGGHRALLWSAGLSLLSGAVLVAYGRRGAAAVLHRRGATLTVVLIWCGVGIFGGMPFWFGAGIGWADAIFESVSGFSTTGATTFGAIEATLGRSLLLWRSLIQWLGGMGIVVLFVAIFPNIGAGGKYLFGEEVPGTTVEGLKPRIAETSRVLWQFYTAFTAIEFLILRLLGLTWFESLCHALTTLSTGGFSTRDASIGAFSAPSVQLTITFFMLLASVNYGLYFQALRGRSFRAFFLSVEFKAFCAIVGLCTVAIGFGNLERHDYQLGPSFQHAAFQVATFVSSTGYGTEDYMRYPAPLLIIVLALMLVGGCAGSTAGGIKIERVILMLKLSWVQMKRSFRPNLVTVVRLGRSVVPQGALTEVSVFFVVYAGTLVGGAFLVSVLEGLSVPAAFGTMLTSLSNMGPAPFHPGPDNFAAYGAASKIVFSVAMIMGRLEFLTVLALLVPGFWRR